MTIDDSEQQAPLGDKGRQAVASLRGYAYQLYASALAWLSLKDFELLHLEVAEDFAIATQDALYGTQVKDTVGSVTLQSADVRAAIESYFELTDLNPTRKVFVHFLTTSAIGLERRSDQRIEGESALGYWRRAAAGANVEPLRALLVELDLKSDVRDRIASMSEVELRTDLLSRIHWHCGAPALADLRTELQAGLVEYVTSTRQLSSVVGRSIMPAVLERVLMTAVRRESRRLRRADLLELIDGAAMVSVPLSSIIERVQEHGGSLTERPSLLVPEQDLPWPPVLAPREALIRTVNAIRRKSRVAVLVGATGLGKSLAARSAARQAGGEWALVSFRDLDSVATVARLGVLIGEIAAAPPTNLILDDLNDIDLPTVRDTVARLLSALHRRDATAIVTSYRAPTPSTFHLLALTSTPVLDVPYLSKEEVGDLIASMGGAHTLTSIAYLASGRGHPQLTMAVLMHLAASGWSLTALANLQGDENPNGLESERRSVRQRLLGAMPAEARSLLIRTSLVHGSFKRSIATELGTVQPSIPHAGLTLDRLVGPWLEVLEQGRLRASPLLDGLAEEVLPREEQRSVHQCVARFLLEQENPSVLDADAILHHALASEEDEFIVAFAHRIIGSNLETVEMLAPFATGLSRLDTNAQILPRSAFASVMLRFAQMLVLIASGSRDRARSCWAALQREREQVKASELLESLILSKTLMHERASEILPDWLSLLRRFDQLVAEDRRLASVAQNLHETIDSGVHATGVMFASQLRGIGSVGTFKSLMEALDAMPSDFRDRCLSSFQTGRGDISVLVNHGWLAESREAGFSWIDAALDYHHCAELAFSWGNITLATRCAIARAMCHDENGNDREGALACLLEAEQRYGDDIALVRARAKLHWSHKDDAAALPLLEEASRVGGQDPVEQAFIAREAGISAARLGYWSSAADWFGRAREPIAGMDLPRLRAMSVGLMADQAHAEARAGNGGAAVTLMADAVAALISIDPDGELTESFCHRWVRHGAVWLLLKMTNREDAAFGIHYPPGAGSNPEPSEQIRSHPLGDIDVCYYFLARADAALEAPTGLKDRFRQLLVTGPILSQEISLVLDDSNKVVRTSDATDFWVRARRHAAMAIAIDANPASDDDFMVPVRGMIEPASLGEDANQDAVHAAVDFLLSFAIVAALNGAFDAVDSVATTGLSDPELFAMTSVLERMSARRAELGSEVDGVALSINTLRQEPSSPIALWWIGAWLVIHLRWSKMNHCTSETISEWMKSKWEHLATDGRFQLSAPGINAPPIIEGLASLDTRSSSMAKLLILSAPAAAIRPSSEVMSLLEEMASA